MMLRGKLLPARLRDRAAAALAVLILISTAHAEVRVSGDATAVQLKATGSTVAEALSALKSAFQVRVKTSTVLDKPIGGTFTGTLAEVLPNLLDGYDYVIRVRATEIEVNVIGLPRDRATAARRPRLTAIGSQGDRGVMARPPRGVPGNAFSLADAVRRRIH